MDLQTLASIVGVLVGITAIAAFLIKLSGQVIQRSERKREYAKKVSLSRNGAQAILRNDGDQPIKDVIVEAGIDLSKVVVSLPVGLALIDFNAKAIPARIPRDDLDSNCRGEIDLRRLGSAGGHHPGGPWTAARVLYEPLPTPYVPAGMTDEIVNATLAKVRHLSLGDSIRVKNYESLVAKHAFKDDNERLRFVYEKWLRPSADVSDALIDLSVSFTDFNRRRWRLHEDGRLEGLAHHGKKATHGDAAPS